MVSFDVESLYTNIPITDALLVIKDLLNNDTTLQGRTNLLPDQILEPLEFLLCTTFFIFNGEFHQQTDGVAMGGPASSIVAEIYMISIEITAITTADTPEDNGILNNKTKTTTNQLKKNLNQSEESISLTPKASVNNFKEHYPSTT